MNPFDVEQHLLVSNQLSIPKLEGVLGQILNHQIDYADLYFQACFSEAWSLEEGIIKDASSHSESGVGVRAVSGQKTGFAYSDAIELSALTNAAQAVKSISRQGQEQSIRIQTPTARKLLYPTANPIDSLSTALKINCLKEIDAYARALDPRVEQVMVSLVAVHELMLVLSSDGTYATDVRPLVRLNISVVINDKGRREKSTSGGGGRFAYDVLIQQNAFQYHAKEAVRQALLKLEALPAPPGIMPVILGPGWPGVLLHEAVGHCLEGDFNRRGSSVFSGRIGELVASPLCTVVDDGTLAERRGSINVDDEGTPSQCTVLIEKGILKGYLQDKLNARLMGTKSTGNGRRESYSHQTMPRMTNTYMLAGDHTPEEIIASVKHGIYAVNFEGGQVDITSGQFVFTASEAYLIENGKIMHPVKGATFAGNGPEVLTKISMLGNDLKLDDGVGTCGKDGQTIPVGVGQPTVKVDELVVGGTQ